MEENKNEAAQEVVTIEAEVETHEGESAEVKDTTDWKAKHDEIAGRLKRAETKLDKHKIDNKVAEKLSEKAGELDETQLDYLDLKGVSDTDEIAVIEKVIAKTGQTVRQALKDDYVQSKLAAIRAEKAVKSATPGATKRGGNQTTDISQAIAKFQATGELPDDFATRTAVVNSVAESQNPNKPAWHK